MFSVVQRFFDPLRLHCSLNILGDIFIILSGVAYGNPVRVIAAILGTSTHIIGILFSKKRLFDIPISSFVMGIVFICGVLYMLSGTNLMGYEETPRYGEILGGLCISIAALCVIKEKGKLATFFFTASTTAMSFSAFEVLLRRGEGDWFILLASMLFYTAGFVAMYIKKDEHRS